MADSWMVFQVNGSGHCSRQEVVDIKVFYYDFNGF